MKTNCPHCGGKLVIPVRCCQGDGAIQGVFTREQYKKEIERRKKEKEEAKSERKCFENDLSTYIKESSGPIRKFLLRISFHPFLSKSKALEVFLAIMAVFILAPMFLLLEEKIPSSAEGIIINGMLMGVGIMVLSVFTFFTLNMMDWICQKPLKKKFFELHPKYEKFK